MVSIKVPNNRKKIWLIAIILFILTTVCLIFYFKQLDKNFLNNSQSVSINKKVIKVELASGAVSQYRGLSRRESLCADCGMLFIFPDKQIRTFVMRNMNFPLDIIFIADGKIINIEKNLEPEGNSPAKIYQSATPANGVLELNGGYCEKYNIIVGDIITFNN
jgi:hypothetical protein